MKLGASYIPPHQPLHLKSDMEYMREIGCSQVMFALQENHLQWLDGSVRFGPEIAEDNGLYLRMLIWGYANTCGGGRSSKVMLENPDMWRCGKDGKAINGGWPNPMACSNNPKTVGLFGDYIKQCRDYGFKSVMIDEPTAQICFCRFCKDKYRQKFNAELIDANPESEEVKEFEHDTVVDFVKATCSIIKTVDPEIETSVCIMPCDREYFEEVSLIKDLDVLGIDPYWLREINKLSFEQAIIDIKKGRQLSDSNNLLFELYLGCFGIESGLEEQIYSGSKKLIEACDPDYVTAWSFRGGIGLGNLSSEECDNPELAWASITRLYRELAGK